MITKTIIFISTMSLFIYACTVRTYKITKERVDQKPLGNRGYLQGAPAETKEERKPMRTLQQVEIELPSLLKFKKITSKKEQDRALWGNLGYVETRKVISETKKGPSSTLSLERYTVQQNDTLQKISQKCYGTTRYWYRIYEANRDIITDPHKIYPGQVINITLEKEEIKPQPTINLK